VSAPLNQTLLLAPTPQSWIERARGSLDVLLVDHANCEKKAASTALALMFAYAEDLELAEQMSRLAREELRHYEQVAQLLRSLAIEPRRLAPGRYAQRLRQLVARGEPQREVDLMICGAFIEARSCERFSALSRVLHGPAAEMFESLHEAEARHFELYLGLARRRAQTAGIDAPARVAAFAALEADLIVSRDAAFRFHSGAPA
jgi:tRNA 2-(methylsulfanyl)-N6-isopentenyladenosine37 hydroxylase